MRTVTAHALLTTAAITGPCVRLLASEPATSFESLMPSLPPSVATALESRGLCSPTPIQAAAIPHVLDGQSIVLHAETGSGKSLAFLLPALVRLGSAGASSSPSLDPNAEEPSEKVLVIAPTRELAVQLANEAATLVPWEGAVQIVAVGATPHPSALHSASVVTCTAPELLALLDIEGNLGGAIDALLSQVRVLVLDELDMLLPTASTYGPNAAQRKKSEGRKLPPSPAEKLVRFVVEANAYPDLQLLAASATVSRPTRLKLARVLRRDPLGRWHDKPPKMVRPKELEHTDLSALPRAVSVPAGVRHFYSSLGTSVKFRRLAPAAAARPKSRQRVRLTLKQKRAEKARNQKLARAAPPEGEAHPLFVRLAEALAVLEPKSALVFLCRSSGLTVRMAAKELRGLGLPAIPLHEAIGLEHAPPSDLIPGFEGGLGAADGDGDGEGDGAPSVRARRRRAMREGDAVVRRRQQQGGTNAAREGNDDGDESGTMEPFLDTSGALQQRHRAVSAAFSANLPDEDHKGGAEDAGTGAGGAIHGATGKRAPLLVTFEDMARGLHFDGVEAVFILGMPDSPATYLHLAGRTGRQPVLEGTVVTICPGKSHQQLAGWATRLGGIRFRELPLGAEDEEGGGEPDEHSAGEHPAICA
jgi:superfamily II DNA/RNA helicase